jgi:hypothetical protein
MAKRRPAFAADQQMPNVMTVFIGQKYDAIELHRVQWCNSSRHAFALFRPMCPISLLVTKIYIRY